MKVLFYDCFSGISGDMNLGAMLDLGIERSFLLKELDKLNLEGWSLVAEQDQRHGIHGTKVTVVQKKQKKTHRHLSDIEHIIKNLKTNEFYRLRVGIGQKKKTKQAMEMVLKKFSAKEADEIKKVAKKTCDAIICAISESPQKAMTIYNQS